jgi:TolB protein
MKADGTGETLLTNGPADEGPSWAPNSREVLFQRSTGVGRSALLKVGLTGGEPRPVPVPQDGSDPDWSGVVD